MNLEDTCLVKKARHRKTSTAWPHFYLNLRGSTQRSRELSGCCQGLGVEKMGRYWSKGTNFHNWWVRWVSYGSLLYSMVTIANNTIILWGVFGNPLQYSCLENPGGLQFIGSQSWTRLKQLSMHTHTMILYGIFEICWVDLKCSYQNKKR